MLKFADPLATYRNARTSWEETKARFAVYIAFTERRRLTFRLFACAAVVATATLSAQWFGLTTKELSIASRNRPDLAAATLLLSLVPWLFWGSAVVIGMSAAWLAYDAFSDDQERHRFNLLAIRIAMTTAFVASLMTAGAGYFDVRFSNVELKSMEAEGHEAFLVQHLGLHEKALLLSAMSGDAFAMTELDGRLTTMVHQFGNLQKADQLALQELLRASLIGGTRADAIDSRRVFAEGSSQTFENNVLRAARQSRRHPESGVYKGA
jgi:hypothetical protein